MCQKFNQANSSETDSSKGTKGWEKPRDAIASSGSLDANTLKWTSTGVTYTSNGPTQ